MTDLPEKYQSLPVDVITETTSARLFFNCILKPYYEGQLNLTHPDYGFHNNSIIINALSDSKSSISKWVRRLNLLWTTYHEKVTYEVIKEVKDEVTPSVVDYSNGVPFIKHLRYHAFIRVFVTSCRNLTPDKVNS